MNKLLSFREIYAKKKKGEEKVAAIHEGKGRKKIRPTIVVTGPFARKAVRIFNFFFFKGPRLCVNSRGGEEPNIYIYLFSLCALLL